MAESQLDETAKPRRLYRNGGLVGALFLSLSAIAAYGELDPERDSKGMSPADRADWSTDPSESSVERADSPLGRAKSAAYTAGKRAHLSVNAPFPAWIEQGLFACEFKGRVAKRAMSMRLEGIPRTDAISALQEYYLQLQWNDAFAWACYPEMPLPPFSPPSGKDTKGCFEGEKFESWVDLEGLLRVAYGLRDPSSGGETRNFAERFKDGVVGACQSEVSSSRESP